MRLLCNLPLECFEARDRWPDFELVTFGPSTRMWVDGVHFPFDVEFDPASGTIEQLLAKLPHGFRPDAILLWWPDQEPLPLGIERAPCPVVGIVSDYNLTLPTIAGLWPYFDLMLVDRGGVDLFRRLSFAAVEPFCQFTWKQPFHRIHPGVARDLDVGFAGNLNPVVQADRAPWLARLLALRERGLSIEVRSGIHGLEYGRFLNRAKIGWNRSIRGEMNLRAFEVPACGAMLMLERENLELHEHFEPGHEVVLYGDEDFEEQVLRYALDDAARERIARAGHARVREYTMGTRLAQIAELVENARAPRPAASPFELELGRATAMLGTWAQGPAVLAAAERALARGADDPRAWNLRALAWLRADPAHSVDKAIADLQRAATLGTGYLPAPASLRAVFELCGRPELAAPWGRELERRAAEHASWANLDGLVFPLGISQRTIAMARSLAESVRSGDPTAAAEVLVASSVR